MKTEIFRLLRGLMLLLVVITVTACIGVAESVRDRNDWQQVLSSADTSVVFGRIEWFEMGERTKIGTRMPPVGVVIEPILLRAEDGKRKVGQVTPSGLFAWTLAPGNYIIQRINCYPAWSSAYSIAPLVGFSVPEAGKSYYVGTLRADVGSRRDFLGGLAGRVKDISIHDYLQRDSAAFAGKLAISGLDAETSLMFRVVAYTGQRTGP